MIFHIHSQDVIPVSSTDELKIIFEDNKGKVILVNFWATWCKPCVKEFPDLVRLYNNYKDMGFVVIFISLDISEEIDSKVKPFLQKNDVEFITYYNNFKQPEEIVNFIDKTWGGAIPATYIYDREGKRVVSIIGSRKYEQFEKELIKVLE